MTNFWQVPAYHECLQLLLVFVPQDLVGYLRESRTPGFSCIPRNINPIASGQVSDGARLLGLHAQTICCQRRHSSGHIKRGLLERHHAGTTSHDGCPKATRVWLLAEILGNLDFNTHGYEVRTYYIDINDTCPQAMLVASDMQPEWIFFYTNLAVSGVEHAVPGKGTVIRNQET